MNAAFVLGQPDFTTGTAATTQAGMSAPSYVAYDSTSQRLFVSEASTGNNRVLVYDLSGGFVNGMAASYVLGQPNFTSSGAATTQTGLNGPTGLLYDSTNRRLFVSESLNNRIMIFDVAIQTSGPSCSPNYSLHLTRPIGGESWKSGQTQSLFWTLNGCQTTKVSVSLTTDGGLTYTPVADVANFSGGFYAWTIPNITTTSAKLRIQAVGAGGNPLATDVSGFYSINGTANPNAPMNPTTSTTGTPAVPPTTLPATTGCTQDTLIKASTPAVYWCGFDSLRHVFPNEAIFKSWYSDFNHVVTIPDAQLAGIPLGRNVTFHPGVLLKLQTDPKVYVVTDKLGGLSPIPDEATASRLYGLRWSTLVIDLPEAFFTDYKVGAPAS